MDQEEARRLLGVSSSLADDDIKRSFTERTEQLAKRLEVAPTEALRTKYRRQLDEFEEAQETLLSNPSVNAASNDDDSDLPVAEAQYDSIGHAKDFSIRNKGIPAHHKVTSILSESPFSATYLTHDVDENADRIVIVATPDVLKDPSDRSEFGERIRVLSNIDDPRIFKIVEVGSDRAVLWCSAERPRGTSLRSRLQAVASVGKPFSAASAQHIVDAIGAALEALHPLTFHGDLIPENVWLTDDDMATLVGFGISARRQRGRSDSAASRNYLAPELDRGETSPSMKTDQFALASMLLEMLTGQPPALGRGMSNRQASALPKQLAAAIGKALSANPVDRFGSIEAFLDGVRRGDRITSLLAEPLTRKTIIAACVSSLVIALLAISYPSWKDRTPWQMAADQREANRLEGIVHAMSSQLQQRTEALRENAKEAASKSSEMTEKLSSLRDPSAYDQTLTAYLQAAVADGRYKKELVALQPILIPAGDLPETIASADGSLRAGDFANARVAYEGLQTTLGRMLEELNSADNRYDAISDKKEREMSGIWTYSNCKTSTRFLVKGSNLIQQSPNQEHVEEIIIGVMDNDIYTEGVAPQSNARKHFKYTADSQTLMISDIDATSRATAKLRRCNNQ